MHRLTLLVIGAKGHPLDKNACVRCHRYMTMDREEVVAGLPDADLASAVDECVEADPAAAVFLFRSLADPARLSILRHLMLGEHRVVDLTNHLGLAQSTTSAHLVCLRDCGLISARTVGRSSVYSLAVSEELLAMLSAAERLLGATGDAVTLCATNEVGRTPVTADPTSWVEAPRARAGKDG